MPLTHAPSSHWLSAVQARRWQYPLAQVVLGGQVALLAQLSASQRCLAVHSVSGLVHGCSELQPGTHAPLAQTP
jgi:hypothetical protein